MRLLISAMLGLFMAAASGTAWAAPFYQDGRFTVRKADGACKLGVAFRAGDLTGKKSKEKRDAELAHLYLYNSEKFYWELFTWRENVGLARENARIGFNGVKAKKVSFLKKADQKDQFWRWQYLVNTEGLMSQIKSRNKMTLAFSNGKESFDFTISLKGSSKAVKALKRCK